MKPVLSVPWGIYFFWGGDIFLILTLLIMLSGFDITSVIRFSRSGAQIIIFFNLSDFWFIFFFKSDCDIIRGKRGRTCTSCFLN